MLKESIERVWTTGEHMVNKEEFVAYMLSLFAKFGEELIGEDFKHADNIEFIDPIEHISSKMRVKIGNELRADMRKRLKEMLKIPSNEGIGEK